MDSRKLPNDVKSDTGNKPPEATETQVFLRRIAPCEDAGKIYEDDKAFVNNLATFVKEGFKAGDGVVVLATHRHLAKLEEQLRAEGHDLFYLTLRDQYVPLDAEVMLEKFMVDGWPDPVLFRHLVMSLAVRVLKHDRHVRVFSEMAALLWLKGYRAASVQLELTWNKFVQTTKGYDHVALKSEVLPPPPEGETPPPASFLRF